MATENSSQTTTSQAAPKFHDIKPLPQFVPLNLTLVLALLLAALLIAALLYFLRRKSKQKEAPTQLPPRPAHVVALEELHELEQKRNSGAINIRDYATTLSLALRSYLEAVLSFPASDHTPREVTRKMPDALKKNLPTLPNEKYEELTHLCQLILRFCERATFSNTAEQALDVRGTESQDALSKAIDCVRQLASWISKEEERRRSVISEGSASKVGAK